LQEPLTHLTVDGGVAAVEPALLPGNTGEVCLAGPPMAVGLVGPPTEFCAKARSQQALPRKTPRASIAAPLFMACPFHSPMVMPGLDPGIHHSSKR
jgi:hypothetical protein